MESVVQGAVNKILSGDTIFENSEADVSYTVGNIGKIRLSAEKDCVCILRYSFYHFHLDYRIAHLINKYPIFVKKVMSFSSCISDFKLIIIWPKMAKILEKIV